MSSGASARDRVRWLGRTATTWILVVMLLVVACVVGVTWTLGAFTSSAPNPKNTVTAGSMSQVNSAGNDAIMSASGMVPGQVVEGTATIENVGDASGVFTLRVKDIVDVPGTNGGVLSSWLSLKVFDGGNTQAIWSGTLRQLDVSLGTWKPGESHTYRFEVTFPDVGPSSDNKYQDSRVTATFEWNAVQSH